MKKMISKLTFCLVVIPGHSNTSVSNSAASYIIGGLIAVLIMGYLVYTLMKPEKF